MGSAKLAPRRPRPHNPEMSAPAPPKRLYIKTYGCQMNVYDSERMADVLSPLGYGMTDDPANADLVVLNTCHIREKATEKVYSELGKIREMKDARRAEGQTMTIAVQHGKQIFNLAASFQVPEQGYEHQSEMPKAPHWDDVEDDTERQRIALKDAPPEARAWLDRPQPIEMRTVDGRMDSAPKAREPVQQLWFRARDAIGADPHMHQVILAYASDMSLLGTSVQPHGVSWRTPGFQSASLDHAMWFHNPTDFNEWHLYHQESPSASGGRGFNLGSIYRASDGVLVASCAQEGLMRMRRPK